jgi:hypothetical protein
VSCSTSKYGGIGLLKVLRNCRLIWPPTSATSGVDAARLGPREGDKLVLATSYGRARSWRLLNGRRKDSVGPG